MMSLVLNNRAHVFLRLMDTLPGETTVLFCFLSPFSVGVIEGKNCFSKRKIFPLRADLVMQGFDPTEKQTRSHKGCFPLKKNGGNRVIPISAP